MKLKEPPTTNKTNKSKKFSFNLLIENKSKVMGPSFKLFFNIEVPNPINNPKSYPAIPPVIPINA